MNTSFVKGAISLALAVMAMAASAGEQALKKGDRFPDLAQFALEGNAQASLTGKVVLVDFWASWCGPCKKSFPVLDGLASRYKSKGFVVIGISVDRKREDMDAFLKLHPVSFTILRDAKQELVAKIKVAAMPTSFLLDKSGAVAAIHNGFRANTEEEYVKEIEELLK